jgi:RecA-family ATPase
MMDGKTSFAAALDALAKGEKKRDTPPFVPLRTVDPTSLFGRHIPVRQWIVQDWLPVPAVTAIYADGGVGKTQLAQQLQTSCAIRQAWLGLRVEPCRSFGLYCEDDEDELHRRQDAINRHHGICFGDLGDMRWASGTGEDNVLIRFERDGEAFMTPRYDDLIKQAKDFGARLLIIDTAADTFGGNENDRVQVRQYISNALAKAAREIGGAVLVNAHPSRTGLSSGNLDGGSTGWNNSVRSRWSLARPTDEEGREVLASPERILTRRKANYSSVGDTIKIKWVDGVLLPNEPAGGGFLDAVSKTLGAEVAFLDLLAKCKDLNMNLSSVPNASNYAPRVFAKRTDAGGYSKREFEGAMNRLFSASKIMMEAYGRSGDARSRIALTPLGDAQLDGEPEQ